MRCTTYFEENEIISYDKYEKALGKLSSTEDEGIRRGVIVRKAVFGPQYEQTDDAGRVMFNICMKNFSVDEIYLEKKTMQNGMIFKSFTRISKKQADRILRGQVQWMENSKKSILQDFFLEWNINRIGLSYISETNKDVCLNVRGLDGIVFKRSVRSTSVDTYDGQFFDRELPMMDDLNCDKVLYSYRRFVNIPSAVSSILHLSTGNKYEVAYSL